MSLTSDIIKQKLIEKFGEQVSAFSEPYGMLTFEARHFKIDIPLIKSIIHIDFQR